MIKKVIKRFRTKMGLMHIVTILTVALMGVSYGTFIYLSDSYKSSNMLISNLLYGIKIEENGTTSKIENNKIIIPGNTRGIFYVTISSINPVNSKYTLAYSSNNTVEVKYSERTNWNPEGTLKGYDETTYNKTVTIVVDNTSNTTSSEITLNAFGGYSYNSYTSIKLDNGYSTITASSSEEAEGTNLLNIVETDTNCKTNTNGVCNYGGDTISNYLQYPESNNVSENLWRVVGSYNLDGTAVTKIISISENNTTIDNVSSELTKMYNSLDDKDRFIYSTNKFNCDGSSCSESNYNNIGLLNKNEYEKLGGYESFLNNYSSFYVLDNGQIKNINESESTGKVMSVIYLKTDARVTGNGTIKDPFIPSGKDINIVAYTLDGQTTTETYENLVNTKKVKDIVCDNNSLAHFNSTDKKIVFDKINVPDFCTVNFSSSNSFPSGSLGEKLLKDNPTISERTDFSVTNVANTTGTIYKTNQTEDGSTVYYYSGNTTNNWVKFGKYTTEVRNCSSSSSSTHTEFKTGSCGIYTGSVVGSAGNDMYWRIIRTNEDGSIRLLYSGTSPDTTNGHIARITFNTGFGETGTAMKYMGYMYGMSTSRTNGYPSNMKVGLESWYKLALLKDYDKYINKSAIYCNDRSVKTNNSQYGAYTRLYLNKTPSYKCGGDGNGGLLESTQAIEDKFSVTAGNKLLTYPIALMTADEVAFAGGTVNKSLTSPYAWYYTNSANESITGVNSWLTMSPSNYSSGASVYLYRVSITSANSGGSIGTLANNQPNASLYTRPVISLKSCVKYSSGTGTPTDPYIVSIDESCSLAEN